MDDTKMKGVMTALKNRKKSDSGKGGVLLGIVQKLTQKRKDGIGGCATSKK